MGSRHFWATMSSCELKSNLLAFQNILKRINPSSGAQVIFDLLKHAGAEFPIQDTSRIDEF